MTACDAPDEGTRVEAAYGDVARGRACSSGPASIRGHDFS